MFALHPPFRRAAIIQLTIFHQFAECMEFFLKPDQVEIWSKVQKMAASNDDGGIRKYVLEAQRLTTRGRNMRIATKSVKVGERSIAPGNAVVLMLVNIPRSPSSEIPNAHIATRRAKQGATPATCQTRRSFGPIAGARAPRAGRWSPSAMASTTASAEKSHSLSFAEWLSLWPA